MRRSLYILLNLALVAALAFVIWLIIDKVQNPQPKVVYQVIAQDEISRQAPELQVKLTRLILQIDRGEGLEAVRHYLKQHHEQGQTDAYDIITNKGFFLAIGRAFSGKIENLPEAVRRVLGPWREATKVGKEGVYVIYRYQPG
jgi:hypothetical protein